MYKGREYSRGASISTIQMFCPLSKLCSLYSSDSEENQVRLIMSTYQCHVDVILISFSNSDLLLELSTV